MKRQLAANQCSAYLWGVEAGVYRCPRDAVDGGTACPEHVWHREKPPETVRKPARKASDAAWMVLTLSPAAKAALAACLTDCAALRPAGIQANLWDRLKAGQQETLSAKDLGVIVANYPRAKAAVRVPMLYEERRSLLDSDYETLGRILTDVLYRLEVETDG